MSEYDRRPAAFVPVMCAAGHDGDALAALSRSAAPRVFIDLEFAVPEEHKEAALTIAIEALNHCEWADKKVSVRVNGLPSLSTFYELDRLIGQAGSRLDAILFPMADTADDVVAIDRFIDQTVRRAGREAPLALEVLIETPRALVEVERIARASPRLTALHFGAGDFAKGMGMDIQPPGAPHKEYGMWLEAGREDPVRRFHPADIWQYALSRIAVTAMAFDLKCFDGPYADIADMQGYEEQCRRARALGMSGKWAISEPQATTVNCL